MTLITHTTSGGFIGHQGLARNQRGVVLFIALIVLVAMSLAGIALMRSVDSGTLIAGNLALRSSAVSAGDAGIEAARGWLTGQTPTSLDTDASAGQGYYANWQPGFSAWNTNFFWKAVGSDGLGNQVSYVIHRMCDASGVSADTARCVKVTAGTSGSTQSGGVYGATPLTGSSLVYYRVTVRVVGPKNTTSYLQAFVY